jgi:hypothetical protein
MEEIQLQTIARVVGDKLHIEVTSGEDTLLESNYHRTAGEEPPLGFVRDQVGAAFDYALELKIHLIRKGREVR